MKALKGCHRKVSKLIWDMTFMSWSNRPDLTCWNEFFHIEDSQSLNCFAFNSAKQVLPFKQIQTKKISLYGQLNHHPFQIQHVCKLCLSDLILVRTFGVELSDCLGPNWAVFGSGRGGVDVKGRGQVRVSSGRTPLAVTCHQRPLAQLLIMEQVSQRLSCGQQTNQYCLLGGTPQWQLYMDQQTVKPIFLAFGQESWVWWEWQIGKPELVKRQRRQLWKVKKSQRRSDVKSETIIIERKILT